MHLRVYLITSLSFSQVIVIYMVMLLRGAGLPLHKANGFLYIIIDRYRYHKNAIINKDISPLVGITSSFFCWSSHCQNNVISS